MLRNLFGVVEPEGVDCDFCLRRCGISADELADNGWIALSKYVAVTTEILKATEQPALGLLAGDVLSLRDQGLFGYAVASCANLEQAIDVYRKYSHINGSFIFGDIEIEDNEVSFRFDTSTIEQWPELHRFEVEQEFALWFNNRRNWKHPDSWFNQVEFVFPEARQGHVYRDYFGCDVLFSQPINRITFSSDYLSVPFSSADETLFRLTAEQCGRLLDELPGAKGITREIRMMLARAVGCHPSLAEVAREFNMSEATLRRRLAAEHTSYKQLVRQFRIELAIRYLSETNLAVNAIAYLVGYSDPASFSRAFMEITRKRPGEFRERAQMSSS